MQIDPGMVTTELPALLTTSAMTVAVIEWLKNTKLVPFMSQHTAALNRTVAWLAAFCTGTGIHYQFDATAHSLTITGLSLAVIGHAVWDTTKSYAFNWMLYKGIIKPAQATKQVASTLANVMPNAPMVTPVVVAPEPEKP